jgi:hypothetical protein
MPNVIAERSSDGSTKEFSFAEVESGALLSWATEQNSNADATAVLIDQGGSASTPSVPSSEKPKIVKSGSLVENYSRAILEFDGTNDGYVYSVANRPALTVAVRCDPQAGSRQTLIDADGLLVYEDGAGTVKARITDGTTTPIVTLARHEGVMNVVAAVGESDLYLRVGGRTASTSHSISRNQSGQVAVGKEVGGVNPLQGLLSDAFAWGRLFTASERRDVFENRLRRWGPLPEPWGESTDLEKVERGQIHTAVDWSSLGVREPDFLLDYENLPPVIPEALQSNHVRSSVATRWDKNGDLVEDGAGTPRLQRDPATGEVLGLLYEPKRAQQLNSPTDLTTADWDRINATVDGAVGSAKGQSFQRISDDSTDSFHKVKSTDVSGAEGAPFSGSFIVKDDGRQWCAIQLTFFDSGASTNRYARGFFDLKNGVRGSYDGDTNLTLIERDISDDLGGGWYRIGLAVHPASGLTVTTLGLELATSDGTVSYPGSGKSVLFIHAQGEQSREVTTPILDGGAVREADEVNYHFDFPGKTTGVAYSIEQQDGGVFSAYNGLGDNNNQPGPMMGTTGNFDKDHGALMYSQGLDSQSVDGWRSNARNTDEQSEGGVAPENETIDRFQMSRSKNGVVFIVRQIAIHTDPHTQAQKSDLESNYLTTP